LGRQFIGASRALGRACALFLPVLKYGQLRFANFMVEIKRGKGGGEIRDKNKKELQVPDGGKYIIYEDGTVDLFIFDEYHSDQASTREPLRPVRAGTYMIDKDGEITVTDSGSSTLGIRSKSDDETELKACWQTLNQKFEVDTYDCLKRYKG
jgi:hypothetical protein